MTIEGIIIGILGVGVLLMLIFGSRALLGYWEQETNMSDDDYAFDRRVASHNDQLANRRRDDEIVRILGGHDTQTVGDRYRRPSDTYQDDDDDDDEDYDDDEEVKPRR